MWKWKRKQNKHKRNRNPWTPGASKWKWKAKKTKRKEKLWDLGSAIRDLGPEKWIASGAWKIFSEYFFGSPVSPEYFLSIFFAALFCPSIFWVFVFVQGRVKSIFGRMDSLCFFSTGRMFGERRKNGRQFRRHLPNTFWNGPCFRLPFEVASRVPGSAAAAFSRTFFHVAPEGWQTKGQQSDLVCAQLLTASRWLL